MARKRETYRQVAAEWQARFGEPPPIRTDARMIRQVLQRLDAEQRQKPPGP